jgi:site-specific DNA-methyltransferase (adenine-specific)
VTPYYDEGGITIYHADCREVLPSISPDDVALVLSDPPYGVSERTDRAAKGRGNKAACHDFPPVHGDDQPFNPTHLLRYPRLILWGANYYAHCLPPSPSWVVWDKLDGLTTTQRPIGFDDNADCEVAWTNCGGPARLIPHRWKGMLMRAETAQRVHPTQKPVLLMAKLIEWRTDPGDLVLDPYMGSGTTLRAAKDMNRRAIGIEIEERYCEIAAKRLAQEVLAL